MSNILFTVGNKTDMPATTVIIQHSSRDISSYNAIVNRNHRFKYWKRRDKIAIMCSYDCLP